jgi:hypothetical protein
MGAALLARPSALTDGERDLAEAMWSSPPLGPLHEVDDTDELLAAVVGLTAEHGFEELLRCQHPDCDAWHWAAYGVRVVYQSGREKCFCADHANADEPGARIYPGAALSAIRAADRATGSLR